MLVSPVLGFPRVWARVVEESEGRQDGAADGTDSRTTGPKQADDAWAAIEVAPRVADVLARELRRDETWARSQCEAFIALASRYLPQNDAASVSC